VCRRTRNKCQPVLSAPLSVDGSGASLAGCAIQAHGAHLVVGRTSAAATCGLGLGLALAPGAQLLELLRGFDEIGLNEIMNRFLPVSGITRATIG
jgi:hypothetical protein